MGMHITGYSSIIFIYLHDYKKAWCLSFLFNNGPCLVSLLKFLQMVTKFFVDWFISITLFTLLTFLTRFFL